LAGTSPSLSAFLKALETGMNFKCSQRFEKNDDSLLEALL